MNSVMSIKEACKNFLMKVDSYSRQRPWIWWMHGRDLYSTYHSSTIQARVLGEEMVSALFLTASLTEKPSSFSACRAKL